MLAVCALLVALGAWTYRAVESSLREIRATSLAAKLDAEARALRYARDAAAPLASLGEVAIGERGELFALDARGVMQSESRFAHELRERGLLEAGVGTRGRFEMRVPQAPPRPLTRLAEGVAASAAAADPDAQRGFLPEPYVNHRGERVIGAWRWVPELQLALAAEIPEAEAYEPLRYLRFAFGAVLAALAAAVAAALASAVSLLRLRGELGARKLGAYRLERRIGEGGAASVYLARHDLLKRPCAVKLLKPARATDEMIARFEREAQLASRLSHPNIVEIYDYGRSADGLLYYAMEYLEGINLGERVARVGPVPVAQAVAILRQICAGLAAAHDAGLVHRDVKPENIMLLRQAGGADLVKLLDFGLVKSVAGGHSRDLTRSLRILGTPLYMAPERLRNPADVDPRADIYAVGAVAYYMLSGRKLFDGADDLALTSQILNEEPRRLSEVAPQPVPRTLELVVHACLEKRPEDRPQRIADLIEALDALAEELREAAAGR
ncbi:MAG: serine/threonine-protein kinase [Burkholderiales bacterium]|nr:serine/threonine-protein kinase [Burkholderiales bacterium]